jgi:hypothetical protein
MHGDQNYHHLVVEMAPGKQGDITKFFSPKAKENISSNKSPNSIEAKKPSMKAKRKDTDKDTKSLKKRIKLHDNETIDTASSSSEEDNSLSISGGQQKDRKSANRTSSQIEIHIRKLTGALHSTIGPSWFAALENEFSKPYFVQLNDFLVKERDSRISIFPPAEQVRSAT